MNGIRFGVFDFDPQTGELRREGVAIRLQSQPAEVLGVLLAHAGEVVTRESLRETVWGAGVYVDFDRGLNFCVAQIRSALGDSAESPRYVKTLPKRGYQFIAPVQGVGGRTGPWPRSRRWLIGASIPAGIAVAGAILAWKQPWKSAPLPRLAVARFDNETGSPEMDPFAEALTDNLVGEMTEAGTGHYLVIGNASVLLQPRSFRDLKMIGDTLNVRYIVLGQVQRNAANLRILAHLIRMPEQTHLTVARIDCDPSAPFPAQSELARRIAANFHNRLSGLTSAPKTMS